MGRRAARLLAVVFACAIAAAVAIPSFTGDATGQDGGGDSGPPQGAADNSDRLSPERSEGADGADPAADAPDVVRIGGLINDIQQLDLQSHSYNVDMYIWFKWTNPDIDPARSFEFMNAFELWGHILSYETSKPEVLDDGTLYQVLRIQGKFNTKLPLEQYPFDTQHLRVEIEDTTADVSGTVFEPDNDPISLTDSLTIPGWDIGDPTLTVVDNTYDTDFGDPRFAGGATYSRAVFDLPVSRPKGTYALKLLLPMLLVALTATLSLLVHPQFVEGRIGIGITALLTLVALQLTSNSSLPEVDYLILLDKLYILSYGFVVLTMAVIVRNSWVDATGDITSAVRADRRGLAWLTGLYFAGVAIIFLQSLA